MVTAPPKADAVPHRLGYDLALFFGELDDAILSDMNLRTLTLPWFSRQHPLLKSAFWPALVSGMLIWLPFGFPLLGPLAWLAPLGWLWLIRCEYLPGNRPRLAIWLAALTFWLCMLEGIRMAHWFNLFGWLVLAAYLALYPFLFVLLTRHAVHAWKWSLLIAAPLVWMGLELARGHLLTGFAMGMLAHTQFDYPHVIQLADLGGAYLVSGVMMFGSACLARMFPWGTQRFTWWPLLPLLGVLSITLGYGQYRLATAPQPGPDDRPLRVALLQEVVDTRFEFNPQRNLETFELYFAAARRARETQPNLDLILWPESSFTENQPDLLPKEPIVAPPELGVSEPEFRERVQARTAGFRQKAEQTSQILNRLWRDGAFRELQISQLVGTETVEFGSFAPRYYNSALLINPHGEVVERYYKVHPVMFGEYLPFGEMFPIIYRFAPMSHGLSRGAGARSMEVAGMRLVPSICFESSLPHLIRRQVRQLKDAGERPDVLVNLAHDGWFYGKTILDLQLAGAVFRSVESRLPMLVAANAGISAWIDGSGRLVARGPRRGPTILFAEVHRDGRPGVYERYGDGPISLCLLGCIPLLLDAAGCRRWVGMLSSRLLPQRKNAAGKKNA
jgi:apolipoprotein N-acyltransferase